MKQFQVTIKGKTPLLMHWDNIDWADKMDAWKNDPASQKGSKGDDRSPPWRWIGSMYRDQSEQFAAMPADNLMRCFMEGGAMVPVPGGKMGKTFKAQSQSGMMVNDTAWPLWDAAGAMIRLAEVDALSRDDDFNAHKECAKRLGFSLFVKRAKVGASKHVRVRPRFDEWAISGSISVWDKQLTLPVLADILTYAGNYKGLGDWRPGSKTPGSWGMFDATVTAA